jgi:hypothetical protein
MVVVPAVAVPVPVAMPVAAFFGERVLRGMGVRVVVLPVRVVVLRMRVVVLRVRVILRLLHRVTLSVPVDR